MGQGVGEVGVFWEVYHGQNLEDSRLRFQKGSLQVFNSSHSIR